MPAHTKRTIQDWPAMREELSQIRSRGYALDLEENEPGVRCIARAILDPLRGTVSSISVSGPRERIGDDRIPEIAREIQSAIRVLSQFGREVRA
jgi:DNA-binding IclR family transcriptional regulator